MIKSSQYRSLWERSSILALFISCNIINYATIKEMKIQFLLSYQSWLIIKKIWLRFQNSCTVHQFIKEWFRSIYKSSLIHWLTAQIKNIKLKITLKINDLSNLKCKFVTIIIIAIFTFQLCRYTQFLRKTFTFKFKIS